MRNLKRVISVLLAMAMAFSLTTFAVFADDETTTTTTSQEAADSVIEAAAVAELASLPGDDIKYADAYLFDYYLGLFEMLEDGYWQKTQVTRGEFATVVAKMMKANTDGYPLYGTSPYIDTDDSTFGYSAICYLTEVGILHGDGNSEFRPNDPILVNEASKMIMCALGFQDACEATNGGFPDGYTSFALRQGVYDGLSVSYTDSMTAMEMAQMVRNAMEAYIMDGVTYNSNGVAEAVISDSKTLLTETYKVYTDKGKVESTYFSTLTDSEVDLENEVVIDSTAYQYSDTLDMEALLGYSVTYYYMEDVSGYRRDFIVYAEPQTGMNSETTVNLRDILSLTNSGITYNLESTGKERTLTFDGDTLVSKNGKPYTLTEEGYDLTEDDGSVKEGLVKIVTGQTSSSVKAVIIQEQIDGLFERYNTTSETIILQNSTQYRDKEDIVYNSVNHTVLTLDGEEIDPEDLQKNDVITYMVSDDGEYVRGFVSRSEISGTIDLVLDEDFTSGSAQIVRIDGIEYYVSAYCAKELSAGYTSDFQLSYDNRIVGTNASTRSGGNYAYLIDVGQIYDGIEETFAIKVLTKEGKVATYYSASKVTTNIVDDTNGYGNGDQRPAALFNTYSELNDNQVIVFDTNTSGQIKTLYVADDYVNNTDLTNITDPDSLDFGKYYDGTDRYSNGLIGTVMIDEGTLIFSVPFSDRNRDSDYSIITKDDLSNGSYTAEAYDVSNGIANVFVVKGKEPTKVSDTASVMFVDEVVEAWDEEEQTRVHEIMGWSNGEYVSYMIDDDVTQADPLTSAETPSDYSGLISADTVNNDVISRGDLIQYELGTNGYIYTYRVLFNYSVRTSSIYSDDDRYFNINQDSQLNAEKTANDDLFVLYGNIKSVYDYYFVQTVSETNRKLYRAFPLQNVNLYIYDLSDAEIRLADPSDVEVGNDVVVRTRNIDTQVDIMVIQD